MTEFFFDPNFADDWRFALSWGLLGLGLCIVVRAVFLLWALKQRPREEKFWLLCGICFHWLATFNARLLFLLNDAGYIDNRLEHLLTSVNLCFAYAAGVFYFRALTQDWKPSMWKYVAGFFSGLIFALYVWKAL